jgi:hypothetical protein
MSLSTKLQSKLTVSRQQRQNRQQAREQQQKRLFTVGVALGLTAGITAFVSGAQHPSNTLPPTPIVESDWRTKVSYSESAPVASPVESAPIEPVPAQQPAETYDEAERVKALALSHAAEKMLERCDRDWFPSTCAKMRAELGVN